MSARQREITAIRQTAFGIVCLLIGLLTAAWAIWAAVPEPADRTTEIERHPRVECDTFEHPDQHICVDGLTGEVVTP